MINKYNKSNLIGLFALLIGCAALPSVAVAAGATVSALLVGAEEVPGLGDPDGSGTVEITLNVGRGTVCWKLTWEGIETPTAAHIHEAPVGVAGGVVVPLSVNGEGLSSGCADVNRDEIKDILLEPEEYYVNIHNATYPAGALRGQLDRGKL